jgi:hypothetical protein
MNSNDFDILDFSKLVKRENILSYMAINSIKELHLEDLTCKTELGSFLTKITGTYRKDVQYHNDLHGADVM